MYLLSIIMSISLLWLCQAEPTRRFQVIIFDTRCNTTAPTAIFYRCSFTALPGNAFTFDISMMLSKDIDERMEVRIRSDLQPRHAKRSLPLFDVRIDACQSILTASINSLLRTLIAEFRKTSNFPATCPYIANTLYKIENYSLTAATFPAYLPDANFTVYLDFSHKGSLFAKQVTWGGIVSQRYATLPKRQDVA